MSKPELKAQDMPATTASSQPSGNHDPVTKGGWNSVTDNDFFRLAMSLRPSSPEAEEFSRTKMAEKLRDLTTFIPPVKAPRPVSIILESVGGPDVHEADLICHLCPKVNGKPRVFKKQSSFHQHLESGKHNVNPAPYGKAGTITSDLLGEKRTPTPETCDQQNEVQSTSPVQTNAAIAAEIPIIKSNTEDSAGEFSWGLDLKRKARESKSSHPLIVNLDNGTFKSMVVNKGRGIKFIIVSHLKLAAVRLAQDLQKKYALNVHACIGGSPVRAEKEALSAGHIDGISATIGRLLDVMNRGWLNTEHVETLVINQEGKVLAQAFLDDMGKIWQALQREDETSPVVVCSAIELAPMTIQEIRQLNASISGAGRFY
ncbi:hypothetical protein DFH27DRAFT_657274 [Peziza echinospora]|nr:hypothetical protein DFH27DRAFT_657274 [Peziza echinospora]